MPRKAFDFFIFSSLFIAICALLMVLQTFQLMKLGTPSNWFMLFVFSSTICSYNFHWYLTPFSAGENQRSAWTMRNKKLHIAFFILGLIGAFYSFMQLTEYWFWLLVSVMLTFLYSAPKIPHPWFRWLIKIAYGKTLFLTLVWTYVTTIVPIIIYGQSFQTEYLLFCLSRFFLIYSICILFDYRDLESDRKEGLKSIMMVLSERGIDRLFAIAMGLFAISTSLLYTSGFSIPLILTLLSPGLILLALYRKAKNNFSDYLYYFILDGLMMFSALLTIFLRF